RVPGLRDRQARQRILDLALSGGGVRFLWPAPRLWFRRRAAGYRPAPDRPGGGAAVLQPGGGAGPAAVYPDTGPGGGPACRDLPPGAGTAAGPPARKPGGQLCDRQPGPLLAGAAAGRVLVVAH